LNNLLSISFDVEEKKKYLATNLYLICNQVYIIYYVILYIMEEVPVDKLVKGQDYLIADRYIPRNKQIGKFIHSDYGAPAFEIRNITKKNGKTLYNGQVGVFGRSTQLSAFFKPRKEEIIERSLQRQALQQTLSALPEDIEKYTDQFLKKKGGFKKYKTLSRRYTKKRENKTNKKSTKKRKHKNKR
jgi:hypothetical protein